MFEVFTFTDSFQAPILCHVANVLAGLLVPIDFLNFSDFDSVILRRTDASYIRVTIEREVFNIQKKVRLIHGDGYYTGIYGTQIANRVNKVF